VRLLTLLNSRKSSLSLSSANGLPLHSPTSISSNSQRNSTLRFTAAAMISAVRRARSRGLDAGLSGCALVLGDIDSLREIWGGCAQFVDPGDTASLQQTLRDLISDADARVSLAKDAHERALQYGPEKVAEGYLKVYRVARHSAHASRRGAVVTA
jgi:glycosyltransferase involved in cell wall biosynthesis